MTQDTITKGTRVQLKDGSAAVVVATYSKMDKVAVEIIGKDYSKTNYHMDLISPDEIEQARNGICKFCEEVLANEESDSICVHCAAELPYLIKEAQEEIEATSAFHELKEQNDCHFCGKSITKQRANSINLATPSDCSPVYTCAACES